MFSAQVIDKRKISFNPLEDMVEIFAIGLDSSLSKLAKSKGVSTRCSRHVTTAESVRERLLYAKPRTTQSISETLKIGIACAAD